MQAAPQTRRVAPATTVARAHQPLPSTVTGTSVVDRSFFRKKLGFPAMMVWLRLSRRRDRNGISHATRETIATASEGTRLTISRVRDALRRLDEAGLVTPAKVRWVPSPGGPKKLVARLVLGCLADAPGKKSAVLVPARTAMWLKSTPGWGGKRAGAFRTHKRTTLSSPPASPPSSPPTYYDPMSTTDTTSSTAYAVEDFVTAGAEQTNHFKNSTDPEPVAVPPPAPPANTVSETDVGLRIGSSSHRSPPAPGKCGVPPFPDIAMINPAVVPAPPKLKPDDRSRDQVAALVKAYKSAVLAKYGQRIWSLRTGYQLERHPLYPKLLAAAKMVLDLGLSPIAWAAWSIDVWREHNAKAKKPPPVQWVFAESRLTERVGWFRRDSGYAGGRIELGAVARNLLARYSSMQAELVGAQDHSAVTIQTIVEHWFPGSLFEDLVDRARVEAAEIQRELNNKAERGEWLW